MTSSRWLLVVLWCVMTVIANAAVASAAPVPWPEKTHAPLRVTFSGSEGSEAREEKLDPITFEDHGAVTYKPGEVATPGEDDASESGSAAPAANGVAFDVATSIDQILDYFANTTAVVPKSTPMPQEANTNSANTSSASSNSSDDSAGSIVVPEKTEDSVFDHDAASADKQVLPSPRPATTAPPQPEAALQSAAVVATICNAAFVALALVVLH